MNIVWFRRDLRLNDNRALYEALQNGDKTVPVFIFDTLILSKLKNKRDRRVEFIMHCLDDLRVELSKKGSDILILNGDPTIEIPKLAKAIGSEHIFTNEDYEPYAKKRDLKIKKELEKNGSFLHRYKDHVIFRGDEVLKKDGSPYKVFTPYKNSWLAKLSKSDLKEYKPNLNNLAQKSDFPKSQIKTLTDLGFKPTCSKIPAGRKAARRLFTKFKRRINDYHKFRDNIPENKNSHLSPYIRFGCLSSRELVREVYLSTSRGAQTWLSEIIWREFYQMILDQFPQVTKEAFIPKYNNLKWPGSPSHYKKWTEGKTGYPIVDAAMRNFANTGEMHNRLRMIVASFLVKDLLIDWKKGERYFAEQLMDFDLASNNGGWQWCASTGCDAQPYFRIFNPTSQSEKFDPDGDFIRKHIPELANFPKKFIHEPSKAPVKVQEKAKCIIGKDYPNQVVDHRTQRILAINLYKNINYE